jgi:hypothetical protein
MTIITWITSHAHAEYPALMAAGAFAWHAWGVWRRVR